MSDSVKILLEVVDKASPELTKFQANLQKTEVTLKSFTTAAGKLGAAATVAVATGLVALTKHAINAADEMGKTAQKIGISVESLSALNYVAGLSDVSIDQLKTGFNALNKSIIEANDPTSAAAAAFKYLGVEVKNADGTYRKADEVFKDISTSIAKLPDGTSKSAVAMEIFGKAGADLIPMLNSGRAGIEELIAEAEKLGLIMSTETTKQAEQFNDSLTRVGNAATGVGLGIAKEVLPTLNALAAQMIKAVSEGEGFKNFAKGVGEVFKWVVKAGAGVVFSIQTIGKGLGALAAAVGAVFNKDFAGAKAIMSEFIDDTKDGAVATAEFMDAIDAGIPPLEKATKAVDDGAKAHKEYAGAVKKTKDGKDEETKSFEKAYAAMLKESEGYKDLTSVQQVEYNIAQKVAGFRTAEHQKQMLRLAEQIDAHRRLQVETQGAADQQVKMAQSLSDIQAEVNNVLNKQTDLFKSSQQTADFNEKARASWNALGQEIVDLGIKLEALNKNPEANGKAIAETKARIAGLQKTLSAGAEDYKDKWIAAALAVEGMNHNMSTFKTYLGDARDKMSEFNRQAGDLELSLQAGLITQEQFNLAMERLNTAKYAEMRSQVTELEKKTAEFAGTIQSTFGDVFYNIMQGNFKDIGTMFKQMLDKMVAEALAAKLAQAMFGDFQNTGSVSGTGGSWLTSLMSMFGFRAGGGPVTAGQPYIVGEKRAEVFVPTQNGTILPDTSSLAMAGGQSVTLHVTAMDSQSVLGAIDKIKRPLAEMMAGTNRSYNLG